MFRGSSHCSTSPPSHRRIFTISSTQDFPHGESPLKIWVNTTRSTQLLSPKNTTSIQEARHNINHLSLEGKALSQTTTIISILRGIGIKSKLKQSSLHLEGYQQNLHNYLYKRGITQNKEDYNTWWSQQTTN